ncbi:MAG: nuclear transport factor 2 family protein [Actinomycetota bacterium]|nr:nuclear transport factor 2 family protein [Actinomycetota bacterium]
MSRAEVFQKAMLSGDRDVMAGALADDVTFWSPAVHKPYEGREAVMVVLGAAHHVLEGLTYTEAVESDDRSVLFFTARVGDRDVEGIDALRFDSAGRVRELVVMIRPHSALTAVMEAMARRLGRV